MRFRHLLGLALIPVLAACPTTTPGGPNNLTQTCQFVNGAMNCNLTGPIANSRIDPLVPGNAPCGINSWVIFGQTITSPIAAVFGQNGDDSPARVRIGVALGPGTHGGTLAKDNPVNCAEHVGPTFAITTTYTGTYVGLVDKMQTPMCIFESRLVLTAYTQNLAAGVPLDISGLTRGAVEETLLRRVDLEIVTTVNGLLQPASIPLPAAATNRSGRCQGDYQPFTGV